MENQLLKSTMDSAANTSTSEISAELDVESVKPLVLLGFSAPFGTLSHGILLGSLAGVGAGTHRFSAVPSFLMEWIRKGELEDYHFTAGFLLVPHGIQHQHKASG